MSRKPYDDDGHHEFFKKADFTPSRYTESFLRGFTVGKRMITEASEKTIAEVVTHISCEFSDAQAMGLSCGIIKFAGSNRALEIVEDQYKQQCCAFFVKVRDMPKFYSEVMFQDKVRAMIADCKQIAQTICH